MCPSGWYKTQDKANTALNLLNETYSVKYEQAVAKLMKDRDELLAFYDFLAEHFKHNRERLRHCPQPHAQDQGMPELQDRALYDFQPDDVGQEEVAQDLGAEPSARGHTKGRLQGRDKATSSCRLIMDNTKLWV